MEPEGCAIFLYVALLVTICVAACHTNNVPNNAVQHDTVYVRDTIYVIVKEEN